MSQYKYGQMTPYIGWTGKQVKMIFLTMMIVTCQILHWAASDFGTDIGRCEFYGPIQNEEESIKVT